jgi:hypothetical protein
MKHVTYGEKAHLMGDDAADTLLEYARLLSDTSAADTVTLRAISPDGNTVDASFLLNANTVMLVESTNSEVAAPDNEEAVREMRERINEITRPSLAIGDDDWDGLDRGIPGSM